MMTTMHPLGEQYLKRLADAARVLPRHERQELVVEIGEHLLIGIPAEASEADVRNRLDDVGPPEDIVDAARPRPGGGPSRRGQRKAWALVLLVLGLPPVIGWCVGLALLIGSPMWTTGQKWLAVLVSVGGLPGLFLLIQRELSLVLPRGFVLQNLFALMAAWLVVQICIAGNLYRAAGRH